jgi:predicted MPP superfamily phosphohydrolase
LTAEDLWVVGDVQGHLEPFRRVLRDSGLIDARDRWTGGSATLAVVGDLVDRGPDGIGVIRFLMQLQRDANVRVLIGNHDVLLLAAHRFPRFREDYLNGGGLLSDLHALSADEVEWLSQLPAILVHGTALLVHADAMLYLNYGATVEEVNARFRSILSGQEVEAFEQLLDEFSEHRAFLELANLERFLATYGGRMVIHGHTPIARMLQIPAETVTRAHVYQAGRCVNVDPGLYLGGPGFAYLQSTRDTGQ